jgi:hypothetical protein
MTGTVSAPWSLIGGTCIAALAAGLSFFFLMRSRTGKAITENSEFLIIRSPQASEGGIGKEMWYILSEGSVIKIIPHKGCGAESKQSD